MAKFNPAYKSVLFDLINRSDFPSHMRMTITQIDLGSAEFQMTEEKFRMQPYGVVHGGNIATLIDSAAFWACYLSLGHDQDGLTSVDLKLNYLAPAIKGRLICRSKLIRAGKSLMYAEASVFADDQKLLAHGTSTLMRMVGQGFKLGVPMFVD